MKIERYMKTFMEQGHRASDKVSNVDDDLDTNYDDIDDIDDDDDVHAQNDDDDDCIPG